MALFRVVRYAYANAFTRSNQTGYTGLGPFFKSKRIEVVWPNLPWITGSFGVRLFRRKIKRGLNTTYHALCVLYSTGSIFLKNEHRPHCRCIELQPALNSWIFNMLYFQTPWPVLMSFLRFKDNNSQWLFCFLLSPLALWCWLFYKKCDQNRDLTRFNNACH